MIVSYRLTCNKIMKNLLGIASILCVVSVHHVLSAAIEPIVETKQGKVKGKLGESRNGRKFVQYLGIPYAQKPQRFQEAGPPEKFEGVKDTTRFGSPCIQFDRKTKGVAGAEDCLFLNVYTPQVPKLTPDTSAKTSTPVSSTTSKPGTAPLSPTISKSMRKLPVLVYIHGGSFVSQSGQIFGPKYFLDEEVLLITFNYRLGALGFLSTGDTDSIANLGLRDQILALKWIKENIEAFGGDANRVTLVGGSAGGAVASYLMLSPKAKGLFSGVISQSGNALCPWVIVRNPKAIALKLAGKLNCPGKTSKEIMTCIKSKSLKDLEIARVSLQGFAEDPAVPFAPVVESWLTPDQAVVPDTPQKLLSQGKAANVPWLTGYNSLNGLNLAVANMLTTPKRLTQVDLEWNKLAPLIFHYSQSATNPANVSEQLRQYYFGNAKINEENKEKLVIALTDRNFIHCTAQAALTQSKFAPVYLYTLSYQGAHSFLDEWGVRDKIKMRGVVHNDELPFLFNLALQSFPELKKDDVHTPFSEKLVKIWTEFAKTGKPLEQHAKTQFEWSPVLPSQSSSSLRWYQLNSASQSVATTIESPTFKVWESFDLGPEATTPSAGKIVVGYTMTEKPTVKPIIPPKPSSLSNPSVAFPAISPNSKVPVAHPQPQPAGSYASKVSPNAGSGTASHTAVSGGLPYGITPGLSAVAAPSSPSPAPALPTAASVSKSSSTTTTTTTGKPKSNPVPSAPTASEGLAHPGVGVFKDDDSYSSTTTTTTKKPGFFSKILG